MFKKMLLPFLLAATLIIITFLAFEELEGWFTHQLEMAQANAWAYSGISGLILFSDVLLPVPSSVVMFTNGYVLGAVGGALLSTVALMAGALLGWYLGRFTSLGLKAKEDARADRLIGRYGAMAIILTRGIPILSESICIVCGYNRMPLRAYLLFNLIGYVPVALLYAICGSLGYDQNTFLLSFGLSLLVSAALWLLGRRLLQVELSKT